MSAASALSTEVGALLGRKHATYVAALVATRIAGPLGPVDTYVPSSADELRPGAVAPRNRAGREVEPWADVAIAPAGVALVTASTRSVDGAAARLLAEAGDRT